MIIRAWDAIEECIFCCSVGMSTLIITKFCAWCTFVFVTTTDFVKLGVWRCYLWKLALVCSKCIAWFTRRAPILPIVINPSYQITAFVQSFHQPKMFKMNETIQPMTINTNFRSVMRINPPKITIKNPNKNISIFQRIMMLCLLLWRAFQLPLTILSE